ncbi:MAG: UvrD-helicase domain-containing protein [Chloroflexi bacterium]|nr:UvrD-helicase domain-containing protein [Chloroflexota bacterium]
MAVGLLDGLNEPQRQAITAGEGPVLVLAGPGSGKTRVLTHRIAYLIREMGVYPGGIMAVTFTNKAAGEMRARVENILGRRMEGAQVGTFHAICARLLRKEASHTQHRSDYLIYDTDDQIALVTQALNELNLDHKKYRPRQMLDFISGAKNELIPPDKYQMKSYLGEIVRRIYERYQELLVASNARDFDDLLMDTVLLLRDNDEVRQKYQKFIEYLLVDEFQDTNMAQYELVKLLAKPQDNVFVVGDEDQAIYGFRGADYRNVLQFRRDFPDAKVILLEQNYRSTQIVLDAARSVIDKNSHRTPKALFTDRLGGAPLTVFEAYSETDEAEYVIERINELRQKDRLQYRDFAVMYRTNAQSRALEEAFVRHNVPYRLIGGVGFYKRREIRDLLAYLRLVNNPDDAVSFTRVINVPKRGIGKKTIEDLQRWALRQRYTIGQALGALANGEASILPGSAVRKLVDFHTMLAGWRELAAAGDLVALMEDIIVRIGYTLHLHDSSDRPEEAMERQENVRELLALLEKDRAKPLGDFLEEVSLVADVDTLAEDKNSVTLLTLHAAKGLEFPVVFITGLEEGLLPHLRSLDEPDGMAEERRLFYVGLTRAMHHLYLTYAFRRMTYGDSSPSLPSRFLADIPARLTQGASAGLSSRRDYQTYQESIRWNEGDIWQQKASSDDTWEDVSSQVSEARSRIRGQIKPFGETSSLRFRTGLRVYHNKFGEGIVIESRRSGDDEEVTISFADKTYGIKRLAASFANLVIMEE